MLFLTIYLLSIINHMRIFIITFICVYVFTGSLVICLLFTQIFVLLIHIFYLFLRIVTYLSGVTYWIWVKNATHHFLFRAYICSNYAGILQDILFYFFRFLYNVWTFVFLSTFFPVCIVWRLRWNTKHSVDA